MKITLVTPTPKTVLDGNQMTARRWARILRGLGHRVSTRREYDGSGCDLLIALHAVKSFDSICSFRRRHPDRALIVTLTGTDIYRDLKQSARHRALDWATRLIVLQKKALDELPAAYRSKTHVIYQSSEPLKRSLHPPANVFRVSAVGNLRPEKDPFRAAMASRLLPADSRIQIRQVGHALAAEMTEQAERESRENNRYRWLGGLPHWKTRRLIGASHLIVISSRMEGSSNVLSEALAFGIPVLASRIPGLIGTLGEEYSGYFPVEDTRRLAELMTACEKDARFYAKLKKECERVAPLVSPERERASWRRLVDEVSSEPGV